MIKISEQLSSLHYTLWNLVILFLWFSLGSILASCDKFYRGFHLMNNLLVRNWLVNSESEFFLIKFWFVGLCILVTLLGVNLVFCSWSKILKFIRVRLNLPKILMLLAHIFFGLAALGHFGGFMLGYKYDNIQLKEGQSFVLKNGLEVKVATIHFIDDPSVLKKSRKKLTESEFHYRLNFAEIVMSLEETEINRGRAFILKPMRSNDIQVTLKGFIPPLFQGNGKKNEKPGVVIVISKNPVLGMFLLIYPLMIITIAIYMVLTWRAPFKNKINQIQ